MVTLVDGTRKRVSGTPSVNTKAADQAAERAHIEGTLRPVGAREAVSENEQQAVKDEDAEHPIASAWRPTFREIVSAFVAGDFRLERGIDSVEPVSEETADHIKAYVADYGETLVDQG